MKNPKEEAKQRAKNYMSLKGALDSQYVDFSNPNADKITSASTTTIKKEPKQIKCYCGHTDFCDCSPIETTPNKTNMTQQTAVEWFQEQIIKIVNGKCELSEIQIFEQAKRMEKDQIIDAYDKNKMGRVDYGEQYYNETYAENKTFKQNKFDPNFMHEWIRNKGMRPTKEKE